MSLVDAVGVPWSEVELSDTEDDTARRLLASASALSYDPATEIDWDAPLEPELYGLNPEWSTLYGTALWQEMPEQQRVLLTRHEVASVMSTGIWFEMILQQMVLRDQYTKDHASAQFRFALTEVADECRHSIMFSRVCEKLDASGYFPTRLSVELGRIFKAVSTGEVSYAGILVAEEMLDVMQRDWMRGENVLPIIRTSSKIHVVEESRHMKFARQEVRRHVQGMGPVRRQTSSLVIAIASYLIVTNMVNARVYTAVGLDAERAVTEAAGNTHHQAMLRSSCANLMDFLADCGLLTKAATAVYQRASMI